MKIKECKFFSNKDNHGNPSATCNLFPEKYIKNQGCRFLECEQIPIIKCPYKKFCTGLIDKEELDKEIKNTIYGRIKEDIINAILEYFKNKNRKGK